MLQQRITNHSEKEKKKLRCQAALLLLNKITQGIAIQNQNPHQVELTTRRMLGHQHA